MQMILASRIQTLQQAQSFSRLRLRRGKDGSNRLQTGAASAANFGSLVIVPSYWVSAQALRIVRKAINVRCKRVENPTDILAQVDATRLRCGRISSNVAILVFGEMAAIVVTIPVMEPLD